MRLQEDRVRGEKKKKKERKEREKRKKAFFLCLYKFCF
jgi:hypothetical protein